jgi:hypothetical protein
MENLEIADDTSAPPPGALPPYAPTFGEGLYDDGPHDDGPFGGGLPPDPPPDPLGASADFADAPPDPYVASPDPRSLDTHLRRQRLFGTFLDDAEARDRQLAVAAASRARSIDELRQVSVAIAAREEAEDAAKPEHLHANRGQESGWSIQNRAKTELSTEVASAFNLSKNAARRLVEESQTLVADLPMTLGELGAGTIRYEHASLIASTAWSLSQEARAAFEQEVLPWAKTLVYGAFRAKVVTARERLHTASMQERHEKAAAFRNVSKELGEDGMGYLTVHDSNEVIAGIFNRLTDLALPKVKDDPRTLSQRRTDIATEILLKGDLCAAVETAAASDDGSAGSANSGGSANSAGSDGISSDATGRDGKRLGHGIVAQVHIEIPLLTLLGRDTTPATLEGIVPIDPATARKLVADAPGFYRLLTDPVTGSIVAFDDAFRYLPKSLRRAVRLVDGHCTAPWCDATEKESDGHHPDEWADSNDTSLDNSALLCQPDHRLVHNTRWTMTKLPNGDKQWISPCGRIRRVAPERRLSPAFVEALRDDPAKPKPKSVASGDDWYSPADPDEVMPF